MPSPAYLIARHLSPQTRWGPNDAPGGIPEFTSEDIKNAIGCIRDSVAWLAIDAKCLDGDRSSSALLQLTEAESWRAWRNKRRVAKIDVFTHENLAEIAFLDWFQTNNVRTDEGRARHLGCSVKTYQSNYREHCSHMSNWLRDKEAIGWRYMKKVLNEAA